jgi:hypothetical protein
MNRQACTLTLSIFTHLSCSALRQPRPLAGAAAVAAAATAAAVATAAIAGAWLSAQVTAAVIVQVY